MTRPLLLSEILWKGELIGYEHTPTSTVVILSFIMKDSRYMKGDFIVQWLSSEIKLRSTMHRVRSNIPEWSSGPNDRAQMEPANDISLGQMI